MGVNSLLKTVTRQRRGCNLNPGPSAPESSTLTTRLPRLMASDYKKDGSLASADVVFVKQPASGFKLRPRRCPVTLLVGLTFVLD